MNGLKEIVEMNNRPNAHDRAAAKVEKRKADAHVQRDRLAKALRRLLDDPVNGRAFAEKALAEATGET